jgi:kynurenine formamidase
MDSNDLEAIFQQVRNWGRWGDQDERGALNFITPKERCHAVALPTAGDPMSLSHDLPVTPSGEMRSPSHHHMLVAGDARNESGREGYESARDYMGTEVHGLGITHIDALCHTFVRGQMYNGFPASDVKSNGAIRNTVMALKDGLIGRGVLLDIPASRSVDYLEVNDAIRVADLDAAEARQGLRVGTGDILFVSTGRDKRRIAAEGDLDPFDKGLAGLHPECLPWIHEREVAVLASDGISDMMPGLDIKNWPFPVHQIGIAGIGLHLIDNCHLFPLITACDERKSWEFLLSLAPIRIVGGTGSPVNPIALL